MTTRARHGDEWDAPASKRPASIPEATIRRPLREIPDAAPAPDGQTGHVTLSDWLDEYRALDPASVARPAELVDDWHEPELLAPGDRLRDTIPRWRDRASRVGYGRPTTL